MIIGICALAIAIGLSFGKSLTLFHVPNLRYLVKVSWETSFLSDITVVRAILVRANIQLQRHDLDIQQATGDAGSRDRVKEAAQLEGLTMEEALQRRHKFRYLY
jgi:hypothetical protein